MSITLPGTFWDFGNFEKVFKSTYVIDAFKLNCEQFVLLCNFVNLFHKNLVYSQPWYG